MNTEIGKNNEFGEYTIEEVKKSVEKGIIALIEEKIYIVLDSVLSDSISSYLWGKMKDPSTDFDDVNGLNNLSKKLAEEYIKMKTDADLKTHLIGIESESLTKLFRYVLNNI